MGRGGRLRPRFRARLIISGHLGRLAADLVGGEVQEDDARRGHPVVTTPRAIPVLGGQVPFARVDLGGDTGVRPPGVGLTEKGVVLVQGRVVHRHRQPVARIRSRRSPSAVDLIPSATSARTERNMAEPRTGPSLSSAASWLTVQRPSWTASATTARTSRRLVSRRAVSATARGARASRTGPPDAILGGIRAVRWSRTKPTSLTLPLGRYEHVDGVEPRPAPDAVVQEGGRAGDHAARAAVEQRGQLFLSPCWAVPFAPR